MTRSATRIQDKDSFRRLSVVQSTQDPTKFGIVIVNPDGSSITGSAGDAKVFTLSSISDITNAQKAYDYLGRGKFPIIKYDGKFYLYSYSTTGNVYFTVWNEKVVDQTSYSTYCKDAIQLAVSSNTVTAINSLLLSTNDSGFLRVGKNYGTAYTPSNDGSPASKKYVDDTAAAKVSNDAYGSGWDGDITHAPSKNAVYDKIDSIDDLIPSAATSSNQLADTNYVNDSINSITAYYITKNANGDQFATYAELAAATTFYSGGVQRTPTRNDYCIVLDDENHDHGTTRYIYQNNQWEYQYTVNETALTQAQLDALNSGITSGKVSTYDGYATTISGKQDALTLPSTPTQGNLVTWGADNETLVDGGAVPTGFNPASAGTTGYVLKKTADGYDWAAESGAVTSVNGQTGAVTVSEFSPTSAGTTDQVLTKTAGGYDWATPAASGIVCDPNSPITITKIRCGTESAYSNLGSYDSSCAYLTV